MIADTPSYSALLRADTSGQAGGASRYVQRLCTGRRGRRTAAPSPVYTARDTVTLVQRVLPPAQHQQTLGAILIQCMQERN
jgi:hypothetical protein